MAVLEEKKLFLLDMDGTIYLDQTLFPGTVPFLDAVRARGGRYLFLTNNSSKSVDAYIGKLAGMGVPAVREDFLTSVDALIADLDKRPPFRKCYVFGTRTFRRQLEEAGISVTDHLEDGVDCLLIGFDTELTFQKLEDACILLNRGVEFIATNPDWVCPTWYGSVPDCGSVCEMLFRATGRRPRVIGKPQPAMALLALERTGFAPEEAVMVGDRLYTDVASGVNAGIDTAFVLSGEGTMADLEASDVKPTWVFDDIAALHRAWERGGDAASLREKWDRLPPGAFTGGGLTIREVRDAQDLWYAAAECALAPGQEKFVNPAGFDIGRAYLNPADNVPCVICLEDGTRIGFIVFRMWLAAGTAYSWGYYLDRNWQGRGYGERAARLALRILAEMDRDMPVKLSAEADNLKARRLYEKIGFQQLDELDGDDLVFGLHRRTKREEERGI